MASFRAIIRYDLSIRFHNKLLFEDYLEFSRLADFLHDRDRAQHIAINQLTGRGRTTRRRGLYGLRNTLCPECRTSVSPAGHNFQLTFYADKMGIVARIDKQIKFSPMTWILIPLLLAGTSACRLSVKNAAKLEAIKAGQALDENGNIISTASGISATTATVPVTLGSLTISGTPDPVYRPGESIPLNISNQAGDYPWSSIKLQYAAEGTTFSDVATLTANETSVTWTVPSDIVSGPQAKLRVLGVDTAGNQVASQSALTFQTVNQSTLIAGYKYQYGYQDGPGPTARFKQPFGITKIGSALYVSDLTAIRKIDISDPNAPVVTTFAGKGGYTGSVDGIGDSARFNGLNCITTDGTDLYVTDGHAIRKITVSTRLVTTMAGVVTASGAIDGASTVARFNVPWGLTYTGANLYVADYSNQLIRKVAADGTVSTFAGGVSLAGTTNSATGTLARFNKPVDVTTDNTNLYVTDFSNRLIRKIVIGTSEVTTLAGTSVTSDLSVRDGAASLSSFLSPSNVVYSGGSVYVSESQQGASIRKIDLSTNLVSTLTGLVGQPGASDGTSSTARLNGARAMVSDGTYLYFTSEFGANIRRAQLSNGNVVTIAGATPAMLTPFTEGFATVRFPLGLMLDGSDLYFTAGSDHAIRKLNLTSNQITTNYGKILEGGNTQGIGTSARFKGPDNMVKVGNDIFFTDLSHVIRRIDSSGTVSIYAGAYDSSGSVTGAGTTARFNTPIGITAIGTNLYVADFTNHIIRKIDISTVNSPIVTTLAGSITLGNVDAQGTAAKFKNPSGITTDGTFLYVADYNAHLIRKVDQSGNVTTLAGTYASLGSLDGTGLAAKFNNPRDLAYANGALYILDTKNHTIRKLDLSNNAVTTIAGQVGVAGFLDGIGTTARFNTPIEIIASGTTLYISDYYSHAIRKMDLTTSKVTTLAGNVTYPGNTDGNTAIATRNYGRPAYVGSQLYYHTTTAVFRLNSDSSSTLIAGSATEAANVDGAGTTARFASIRSMSAVGNALYFVENFTHVVRKLDIGTGTVTTVAGTPGVSGTTDGIGTAARFNTPRYITGDGTNLFVTDSTTHILRKIVIATGEVTTIAGTASTSGGTDGIGAAARFSTPDGLVMIGNTLYLSCSNGQTIRKVDLTDVANPVVTTLAGTHGVAGYLDGPAASALFSGPKSLSTDGKHLYVSDDGNWVVRKINLTTNIVSTYLGSRPLQGQSDGPLSSAGLSVCSYGLDFTPQGLYLGCGEYMLHLN